MTCATCATEFAKRSNNQKHCSPECNVRSRVRRQNARRRKPRVRRICARLRCEREFKTTGRRVFCSDSCRWYCALKGRREMRRAA